MLHIQPQFGDSLDLLALGEVMLRFDPGETRIRCAREFKVWEGGGEYNVARGLRKCFGMRTGICTALVDNEVGRLVEDLILQGGVDTRWLKWVPFDGVGRQSRNALNFVERGFGLRAPIGNSDRAHTPTSQLRAADFDWQAIFATSQPRWFHTGGVFTALGAKTPLVAAEAVTLAREKKAVVSFDLNYRASLWNCVADPAGLQAQNRAIVAQSQVLFADPNSARASLGMEVQDLGGSAEPAVIFESMVEALLARFSELEVIGATFRSTGAHGGTAFQGFCRANGQTYSSRVWSNVEALDRIGTGDAFAAGLIYGLMDQKEPQLAVDFGTAHAVLATTTPGDNSMASLEDVEALLAGAVGLIRR
jgi:2-dehydro-3-deoxygluconokinase